MKTRTATADAVRIRAIIDEVAQALRARDVSRLSELYAADIRTFDAVTRLQFRDRDDYLEHCAACLAWCPGPMIFDVAEVEIEADGDLAVAHLLCRCGAVDENGQENASWMRATFAFRRIAGDWKITHDHYSVPFDMKTGQMLTILEP